jgi:hypothetical protein
MVTPPRKQDKIPFFALLVRKKIVNNTDNELR